MQDDVLMPSVAQVGMVDVGCGVPGTDSRQFSSTTFQGQVGPIILPACAANGLGNDKPFNVL